MFCLCLGVVVVCGVMLSVLCVVLHVWCGVVCETEVFCVRVMFCVRCVFCCVHRAVCVVLGNCDKYPV